MPALSLEVDFASLPPGALPASFPLGGFRFDSRGATPKISNIAGEQGYVFPDAGVDVSLPALCEAVDLRVCTGAGDVAVEALSSLGAVVAVRPVTAKKCQDIRLLAQDIAALRATGGTGEACIVRIAVSIDIC